MSQIINNYLAIKNKIELIYDNSHKNEHKINKYNSNSNLKLSINR